jgi:hypothetical protein
LTPESPIWLRRHTVDPCDTLDAAVDGYDRLYEALGFGEDGKVTVKLLDDEGQVVDGAA